MTGRSAACGSVTAGVCLTVFALLSEDQVPGAYDAGDATIAIFGAPVLAGVAAVVIGVMCQSLRWFGRPVRIAHTVLPFGLWLFALIGIAAAGSERNNAETGLLWAATGFGAHLLIAPIAGAGRRALAVLALVAVCGTAIGVTVTGQHRWRTQKFARVGVPAYVPDVPGYRLTGAHAGRSAVSLLLQAGPGPVTPARIDVWLTRTAEDRARCPPGDDDRWVSPLGGSLHFCLPAGGVLVMMPGYPQASIEGLLPSVRLREVTMSELAAQPDGGAAFEAD